MKRKIFNMQEIQFVLLDAFADWEAAFLAAEINRSKNYRVKTVSLTKNITTSIGGFSLIPDYDLAEALNRDFGGLVLIGGNSWRTPEAEGVAELVSLALTKNVIVAGICDASVYLGAMGVLNKVPHTSNQLEDLQNYAGTAYTGASNYKNQQAVKGENIITANGTASLEFAKEVLVALGIMCPQEAEQWYRFYKLGYYEATK